MNKLKRPFHNNSMHIPGPLSDKDFHFWWTLVQNRPLGEIETMHVLLSEGGDYHCLDLDVHANSKQEIVAKILEIMRTADRTKVHPHAPLHDWKRIDASCLRSSTGGKHSDDLAIIAEYGLEVRIVKATR